MSQADTTSVVAIVKKALEIEIWTDSKGSSYDSALYVLPEFQRNFTWKIQQTIDLFDSIFRNVYIGSLVLGEPSFDIAARRIDLSKRSVRGKGKKNRTIEIEHIIYNKTPTAKRPTLILDGQQRVSSLTRAMVSDQTNDHVFFIAKDCPATGRTKPDKTNLVEHLEEFSAEINDLQLAVEISHVWKLEMGTVQPFNDPNFLSPLVTSNYYKALPPSQQKAEELYFGQLVLAIKDLMNADKIVQVYQLDTALENFTLFFERCNTAGIDLNFIDILCAKLYSTCRLRKLWNRLSTKTNLDINSAKEPIIRLINYFSKRTDPKKCNEIGKASILKELTGVEVNLLFDEISESWQDTVEWLIANHIVPAQKRLPYPFMVMPIMAYRFMKKMDLNSCPPDELEDITKWITTVSLSERYSMKTNERYKRDIAVFIELASGKLIRNNSTYLNEIKHDLITKATVIDITATSGAIPKAMANLISYTNKGYISWLNGKLMTKWNEKDAFESHHIYPNSFLKDNKMTLNKESIVNRAYIPKLLNISIGKKDPQNIFR